MLSRVRPHTEQVVSLINWGASSEPEFNCHRRYYVLNQRSSAFEIGLFAVELEILTTVITGHSIEKTHWIDN